MASGEQAPQASEKNKVGALDSMFFVPKKVQFGATNSIAAPTPNVSAQPNNGSVNQAANGCYAKLSSRIRSELEEITNKRMAKAANDVLGVTPQSINEKLVATVIQHLAEQYGGDVRERVYNEYESTFSCFRSIAESAMRTEFKDTVKQEIRSKCRTKGTIEYNAIQAEHDALRATLRAEEREKIQKELDEERLAMKAAMKAEQEQDIKRELKAEMGPSVHKELTEEFIKRLTEGFVTEPTENTAEKEPPVAKHTQAAPTHATRISDIGTPPDIQVQSSASRSAEQPAAQQATLASSASAAPTQPAPDVLPSIETADPPAAADQSRAPSVPGISSGFKRPAEELEEYGERDFFTNRNKRMRYCRDNGFNNFVWYNTMDEWLDRDPPPVRDRALSVPSKPVCKEDELACCVRFWSRPRTPVSVDGDDDSSMSGTDDDAVTDYSTDEDEDSSTRENDDNAVTDQPVDEDKDSSTRENDHDAVNGNSAELQDDASLENAEPTAEQLASLLQDDGAYVNLSGEEAADGATGLLHNDNASQQGSALDGDDEESVEVEDADEDLTLIGAPADVPFEIKIKTEAEDESNVWLEDEEEL